MTELSPETKKLFEAARDAYSPSTQRVDALQAALQARIAAQTAAGGAATASGSALALKTAIVLGLATAAVVGVGLLRGPAPVQAPAAPARAPRAADAIDRASPPAAGPAATTGGPSAAGAPVLEPHAPSVDRPAATPKPVVSAVDDAEPVERRAASAPRPTASRRTTPAKLAPVRGEPASAVGAAATTEVPEPQAAVTAPEREDEPASAAPVVVGRDELDAEIRLLRAARAALDNGAAERALSIVDAHAERYPRGTLLQEQLATRALALCALDRVSAARAALRELSLHSPSSPHLARLRSSCAWPAGR